MPDIYVWRRCEYFGVNLPSSSVIYKGVKIMRLQKIMKQLLLSFFIVMMGSTALYAQEQQNGPETDVPNLAAPSTAPKPMNVERIRQLIGDLDENAKVNGNTIEFTFAGRALTMIAAPQANRMRIVSGIVDAQELSPEQLLLTLVSNYHLALDARYAVGSGILFSTYVHPLEELNEELLLSGIRQVANLAETFGTTYTSGELSFGVIQAEREEI